MCELILHFIFLLEEFPDNNDCGLEQSTNKNLFDFLTSSATSDDFLEDNLIAGDTENISVLQFERDVDNKFTSNGKHFICIILT